MRTSKKTGILDAAVGLIEESGVDAITYEALSAASGMSKSGLIYHFPSLRDLMLAIHHHLAAAWEAELEEAAGGAASEVSASARLRAMVMSLSRAATRAELLVQLDAAGDPELAAIWDDVDRRWKPPADRTDGTGKTGETARAAYLVQLASDGLWMHDYIHQELTEPQRRALVGSILALIPEE